MASDVLSCILFQENCRWSKAGIWLDAVKISNTNIPVTSAVLSVPTEYITGIFPGSPLSTSVGTGSSLQEQVR